MFIDTTLLIDFLRGKPAALKVIKEAEAKSLATSEINAYELIEGVYENGTNIDTHLEKVLLLLSRLTVFPFDRRAAIKAGIISSNLSKAGRKIGEVDCLIAAVALANGIPEIATQNKEHFNQVKELKVITY